MDNSIAEGLWRFDCKADVAEKKRKKEELAMAKKKRETSSESINVNGFGNGFTVSTTRYYKSDTSPVFFREVYADRIELIKGLAKYLDLKTTNRVTSLVRDALCILEPKPEKPA